MIASCAGAKKDQGGPPRFKPSPEADAAFLDALKHVLGKTSLSGPDLLAVDSDMVMRVQRHMSETDPDAFNRHLRVRSDYDVGACCMLPADHNQARIKVYTLQVCISIYGD